MSDRAKWDPRHDPWLVDADDFPATGTFAQQAGFLLRGAILAPSGHNTQPWRFTIDEPCVVVAADPGRRLPVADPDDRELTMSLGAAVTNLRVAAARFGLSADLAPADGAAARVRLGGAEADPALAALFPALTARRTWRLEMDDRPLEGPAAAALTGLRTFGGAESVVVTDDARRRALTDLIHDGDLARMSDTAFRRELAHWMRPAHTKADDGLAGDSLGLSAFASGLAAWTTRKLDMGRSVAARDVALAERSAALVVVLAGDAPQSLLDAGQLLETLLLRAALHGVAASFFNLPVEVPEIRARMKEMLGAILLPQLLLRVGYPAGDGQLRPSARRPLEDCLTQ